jgi:hypothetical protein
MPGFQMFIVLMFAVVLVRRHLLRQAPDVNTVPWPTISAARLERC